MGALGLQGMTLALKIYKGVLLGLRMKKRGLSDVVTTVLIVLLALAAIAIVWAFIVPIFYEAGGGIDTEVDLKVIEFDILEQSVVVTDDNNVTFLIERAAGGGGEAGVVVGLTDDLGNTVLVRDFESAGVEELQRITLSIPSSLHDLPGNITRVDVYPTVEGMDGNAVMAQAPTDGWGATGGGGSSGGGSSGVCGDGNVDAGEECDDGGTVPGDGCDGNCLIEGAAALSVVSSYPPDEAIDARQPTDVNDDSIVFDGWSVINVTFDGDPSSVVAGDFSVSVVGGGPVPSVSSVVMGSGTNEIVLTLDIGIPLQNRTIITYTPSGDDICLAYLPGDAGGDGVTNTGDILDLIDYGAGYPLYRSDIDRSGVHPQGDSGRLTDLINGAGVFKVWGNEALPGSC